MGGLSNVRAGSFFLGLVGCWGVLGEWVSFFGWFCHSGGEERLVFQREGMLLLCPPLFLGDEDAFVC